MDYVKPADVVSAMIAAGKAKAALAPRDLLIRGMLAGALLGVATSLAFGATLTTGQPIVGALIFPAGFVMICILGLEPVTGSFAIVPLAKWEGSATTRTVLSNWAWVFLGNLIGSIAYGALFVIALTNMGTAAPAGVAATVVKVAEAKTIANEAIGLAGMVTVFVKGILCNWLVSLGVVMGLTSNSTAGKIVAIWLPIVTFFAQGYEHTVVNMFVIPTGMMMGAKISVYEWWAWNQIPVTLGNLVGGLLFTGGALYLTFKPAEAMPPITTAATQPAE